jgi:hypothetical protein
MAITIPKSHLAPLLKLLRMSDSEREALVTAVQTAPALLNPETLASGISKSAQLEPEDATAFATSLVSMYLTAAYSDSTDQEKPLSKFVSDVSTALRLQSPKDAPVPENRWNSFESTLLKLLSAHDSLGVTAKALDLSSQHERVFHNARIFTDVRPVFKSDPKTAPPAVVFTHTLKLTFHDGPRLTSLYFSLDAADLKDVKGLIDRALDKEATLRAELASTKIQCLGSE